MANELPKKPIKRNTVPKVSKEIPSKLPVGQSNSNAGQNVLLFLLFILVSGVIYMAIFQKEFLSKFISSNPSKVQSDVSGVDTLGQYNSDTLVGEELNLNTFIGQDADQSPKKYAKGSKYYLIAGTFIFYPYAEKRRDLLKSEGYDAAIISTGENRKFHRVYIQSSTDPTAVRAQRDELRNSKSMDVWVYAE